MRFFILTSFAMLVGTPEDTRAKPRGSYDCTFTGNWGCAAPPEGICVDSARLRPGAKVYSLQINYDRMAVRLSGLDGGLEEHDGDYWVYWRVSGLGRPKLVMDEESGRARLILPHPDGGASMGAFKCRPATGSAR